MRFHSFEMRMKTKHKEASELKPRRVVIRGQGKCGYAVGRQRLRGVHRFLDELLVPIETLSASDRAAFDRKAEAPRAEFTAHNPDASERKRGPMKTSFSAGLRLDAQVRAAIRAYKRTGKWDRSTWSGTVLMMLLEFFRYKPTHTQLLCVSQRGDVGTEIDFMGVDALRKLIFFELKSTAGGVDYVTAPRYAWSKAFWRNCSSGGGVLPRMLLTQCHRDLLQVLVGRILYEEHAARWKTRMHSRTAQIRDLLVIRSPQPDTAEAYRVPAWMAGLTQQILSFMCATAKPSSQD